MNVEYTGRRTNITPQLKEQTEAVLERIKKVSNRCTKAHIILSEDKYRKKADIAVQCRGENLVATCESTEMEQALRDALMKVEQQAIRSKERFTTVRSHPKPAPAATH
jgi:putative sigma-54 modulation protein